MARLVVDGMSVFKTVAGMAAHLDRGYAYSFITQVAAAVKNLKPSGVDVCWEGGFAKRTELLPDYKSKRTSSPQEVVDEREELKVLLSHLGVQQYVAPGHEADDMIGSLVTTRPGKHIIMSADKDMLQLVGSRVSVYQKVRGAGKKSRREIINADNFQEKTGWPSPQVFLEAHCALGDAVDQIPKVPGVGEGVIHGYFMGMDIPPSKRAVLENFFADSPQYLLNKKLIELGNVGELNHVLLPGALRADIAYGLLVEMGFASIAARFDTWVTPWEQANQNADFPTLP